MKLEILYQDEDILIINKKAGLAVHGGQQVKKNLIDEINKKSTAKNKHFLLHRLDKETAGILILSKKTVTPFLTSLIEKSEKKYLALVKGRFSNKKIILKEEITINGKAKPSESHVQILQGFSQFSLLEILLKTGRFHQIRKNLAQINHPILGDAQHGNFRLNHEKQFKNLFLIAHQITLFKKKKKLVIKAPLPDYFRDFLKKYQVHLKVVS